MQQKQTKLTGSVKETRRGRFQVSQLRGGRVQLAYLGRPRALPSTTEPPPPPVEAPAPLTK